MIRAWGESQDLTYFCFSTNLPGTVFQGDYGVGSLSVEGKKEFLEITRNSIEVFTSIVNSASVSEPTLPKDEMTMSMIDKCKDLQPVLQRIIETTTEDETMLFEALNLHDEHHL